MTTKVTLSRQLAEASGPIETTLKNDMMFHMVMARAEGGLKGLICALKGLREEDVRSVKLLNPISYDDYLEKEIVVDTLVELNNGEILIIELQVRKDPYWIKRSLLYLCRAYDNIKGEQKEFDRLKPTTHIGILDYDLFPDHPEFYAKYLLTNVETGHYYTTIFGMNVLSLKRTELATEEDKANRLDYWAKVFRAETWEDLKFLAKENQNVAEVAETMYQVSAEESARSILRARRKYEEIYTSAINGRARAEKKLAEAVAELSAAKTELSTVAAERDTVVAERDTMATERDTAVAERNSMAAKLDALQQALAEAQAENERLKAQKES